VLFAVIVGASMFALQEWVLPTTNREADRVNRIARGKPPLTSPLAQRWLVGRNSAFYHYDLFDNHANKFVHLWMYDLSEAQWALRRMTYVADAELAAGRGDETLSDWQGRNGWVREFGARTTRNAAVRTVKFETFADRPLRLEPPAFFSNRVVETEQMTYDQLLTYGELQNYIDQLRASGADAAPFVVALRRKVAFPFVTIIMTLIAVPFATSTGRRGALYGIGVGLTLAIAYWVMTSLFGALGKTGVLTPELAAWAPNILFGAGALYMVLTVRT
jgi:lipopolysaccharide export LptBFGC system permease protein LptF